MIKLGPGVRIAYVKMTKISKHKNLEMSYLECLDCKTVDYTI